ncbi:DUF4260 domain-containing protein [Paracoccus aerodenitrificans]|uniref:DUF4260 domain-containing protein n=1 Tax=Paracoccus aerodenitrificans TaxID=3017781 RepID=UPI0022F02102|nr:DUF4260 domain-containing protein [Paracoccus aerodenitrificans]WBU62950.1 DUF4260 domain-containing protein [Paracoccus aerodenitrificans]
MSGMVIWQRAEGAVIFLAGIWVCNALGLQMAWWWLMALFFAPDLAFAAYLAGPRIGAVAYNVVHNYGFGLVLLMLGSVSGNTMLIALGALWFGHSGFDRMLGYGLKSQSGFTETHLGRIGRLR